SRVLPGVDSSPVVREADIFDRLVAAGTQVDTVETDDAVGPAVHVPYRPTPLPPRTSPIPLPPGIKRPATLLRAPEAVYPTPIPVPPSSSPTTSEASPAPAPPAGSRSVNATQPLAAISLPPAARTAPILILDEDAFYHPAGRIRTLADATLEGYRPEPTLLVRLRQRRHTLSWVVGVVLAVFALVALFAGALGFGRAHASAAEPVVAAPVAPPVTTVKPVVTAAPKPEPTPTAAPVTPVSKVAEPAPVSAAPADVPVFDVNSLKSVPASKPRR
ncbi:MAG: hypothetical protein K0S65_5230, partial [Labilithrix sp.]|nr:hypothetical protein [Labilithrix sp.]